MDKLWGKAFEKKLNPMILEFSKSIEYDWILFPYLAELNLAYVKALRKAKILSAKEEKTLINGIKETLNKFQDEKLNIDFKFEDVHSLFYSVLRKKVGNIVNKIHAGKSRNDEIVTLLRMFLKDIILDETNNLENLQKTILEKAYKHQNIIIPGFTHLQFAQVILFSHLLLSWIEQIERDKERLIDLHKRVDILAIGSSAFSGTSIPIDREFLAKELQFSKIGNSIDMVSDRDFILEYLGVNSIIMIHFSRICEDLIIYFSPGYKFIEFDESLLTGSSIMPQKKNPDPLELIRGYSSEAISCYVFLANLLKGLPFTYNRDLQLDKIVLLRSWPTISNVIEVFDKVIMGLKINKNKINDLLKDEDLYVTDIVEELILKGVPWRKAKERVEKLIKISNQRKKKIKELGLKILKKYLGDSSFNIEEFFNPLNSIKRKKVVGGTNPSQVKKQLLKWRRRLS